MSEQKCMSMPVAFPTTASAHPASSIEPGSLNRIFEASLNRPSNVMGANPRCASACFSGAWIWTRCRPARIYIQPQEKADPACDTPVLEADADLSPGAWQVIMLFNYVVHETRILLRSATPALLTAFGEALPPPWLLPLPCNH